MVQLDRSVTEELIYGGYESPRFTQDSPILPDVWIQYGLHPLEPQKLLLTPHFDSTPGVLSSLLRERIPRLRTEDSGRPPADVVYNQSYVAVDLYFDELIRLVLPLTPWWQRNVWKALKEFVPGSGFEILREPEVRTTMFRQLEQFDEHESVTRESGSEIAMDLLWMMRIVGSIAWVKAEAEGTAEKGEQEAASAARPKPRQMIDALVDLVSDMEEPRSEEEKVVWLVNLNRTVHTAIRRSSLAVKADAARLLFQIDCSELSWGIIDSGIDARHPAFSRAFGKSGKKEDPRDDESGEAYGEEWAEHTRVVATYDFTRIRDLLNPTKLEAPEKLPDNVRTLLEEGDEHLEHQLRELKHRLLLGRSVDWGLLEPFLRIPHDQHYEVPRSEHGTHVAGILGADWPQRELSGLCPDIQLYDLRVLRPGGANDEFAVLAALQFIQYLNSKKDFFAIQGTNLSLAIRHDVANFACGRTPVCDECQRLVASGVVVVAAAGNAGYLRYMTANGESEGYHTVSITDPGNADKVITVGATHRYQPHTYGVSYFSSRGPTGDGRLKPDLVAPGEKIKAPTPHADLRRKDGTSMAAPHVSGAAALLMARHIELIGQPERVKEILCATATNLGREPYFQGAGMVDVLRALQSL